MKLPKNIFTDVFAIVKDYLLLQHLPTIAGKEIKGEITEDSGLVDAVPEEGSARLVLSGGVSDKLAEKQNKLIPGENITIVNDHISAYTPPAARSDYGQPDKNRAEYIINRPCYAKRSSRSLAANVVVDGFAYAEDMNWYYSPNAYVDGMEFIDDYHEPYLFVTMNDAEGYAREFQLTVTHRLGGMITLDNNRADENEIFSVVYDATGKTTFYVGSLLGHPGELHFSFYEADYVPLYHKLVDRAEEVTENDERPVTSEAVYDFAATHYFHAVIGSDMSVTSFDEDEAAGVIEAFNSGKTVRAVFNIVSSGATVYPQIIETVHSDSVADAVYFGLQIGNVNTMWALIHSIIADTYTFVLEERYPKIFVEEE